MDFFTNLWTVIAARMAPNTKTMAKSVLTHARQLIWALILFGVCHSFIDILRKCALEVKLTGSHYQVKSLIYTLVSTTETNHEVLNVSMTLIKQIKKFF